MLGHVLAVLFNLSSLWNLWHQRTANVRIAKELQARVILLGFWSPKPPLSLRVHLDSTSVVLIVEVR